MQEKPQTNHSVAITALGTEKPNMICTLSDAIKQCGGNIVRTRATVIGKESAAILMIEGPWSALAKLESALARLEKEHQLTLITTRTEPSTSETPLIPYNIHVISLDAPGIIHKLTNFFVEQDIAMDEINTETFTSLHTDSKMFSMSATILIPTTIHIATLREQFILFCDDLNLDAILEPCKA